MLRPCAEHAAAGWTPERRPHTLAKGSVQGGEIDHGPAHINQCLGRFSIRRALPTVKPSISCVPSMTEPWRVSSATASHFFKPCPNLITQHIQLMPLHLRRGDVV